MESSKIEDLNVRIIRLSKPAIDIKYNFLDFQAIDESIKAVSLHPSYMHKSTLELDSLRLSSNFGHLHLGEFLGLLLIISNNLKSPVYQVAAKVELQTANQKYILYDSAATVVHEMEPAKISTVCMKHEVKEVGLHVLNAIISYQPQSIEDSKKIIKKSMKFSVINPLSVKTKMNAFQSSIYLEAQIQNISSESFFLSKVLFDPSEYFAVADLNGSGRSNAAENGKGSLVFDEMELKPDDVRQYLFQLTRKSSSIGASSLGKIDISWATQMGNTGRLITSSLNTRTPFSILQVELQLTGVPEKITADEPFNLYFRIKINSSMDYSKWIILLDIDSSAIVPIGQMLRHSLEESAEFQISLVALSPGIQKLAGFVILDESTQSKTELGQSFELFVNRREN